MEDGMKPHPTMDFELTVLALEKYLKFQTEMSGLWKNYDEETWLQNMEPVEIVTDLLKMYEEDGDPVALMLSINELEPIEIETVISFFADEGLLDEITALGLENYK